jgi:hypothetical protein
MSPSWGVAVTVLIAATGEAGVLTRERLRDDGFTVERAETLANARVRATTVDVAVVGTLADASATDLRDTLREADARTPLVGLGEGDDWDVSVAGPRDEDLPLAVQVARHAGHYRDAIDDLFEQSREGERDIEEALQRADEAFAEARQITGRTPFEQLLNE